MAAEKTAKKKTTSKRTKKTAPKVTVEEVVEAAPQAPAAVEPPAPPPAPSTPAMPAPSPGGSVVPDDLAAAAKAQQTAAPAPAAPAPTAAPAAQAQPQESSTILPPTEQGEGESEDSEVPLEKQNNRIYIIGIVVALIVIAATAGVFYMRTKQSPTDSSEGVQTSEEEASPEPEASATPEPETSALSREEISLEVLNGSGVAGLAGKTSDTFEALGYEIADTGNADDTTSNELYIRDDLSESDLEVLLKDVKKELGIEKVTDTLSSDELEAAARIVLGSEEAQ